MQIKTESIGTKRKGMQRMKLLKPPGFVATNATTCTGAKRAILFNAEELQSTLEAGASPGEARSTVPQNKRAAVPVSLAVVKQLMDGMPLERLVSRHKLIAKKHPKFPALVQLSYNQLESSMASPVVQECRGLILERDRSQLPLAICTDDCTWQLGYRLISV